MCKHWILNMWLKFESECPTRTVYIFPFTVRQLSRKDKVSMSRTPYVTGKERVGDRYRNLEHFLHQHPSLDFLKPIYGPRDLHMQLTVTVWTTLIGDHPGTIPVEFGQISISGPREDVVWSIPYIIQCKIVTPGAGSILTPGA